MIWRLQFWIAQGLASVMLPHSANAGANCSIGQVGSPAERRSVRTEDHPQPNADIHLGRSGDRSADVGESPSHCAKREKPIPEVRCRAIPGVNFRAESVAERDSVYKARAGVNQRRSTDSQLK